MVDCTGNRIVQSDPNAFVKDAETCTTEYDGFPVGSYAIVPFTGDNWDEFLWASDFEAFAVAPPLTDLVCVQPESTNLGVCFRTAVAGSITVDYSKKSGLYTWSIVAYYAP